MSFAVVVTYSNDNIDKATIAMTLANAALDSGERVAVILASEGVRLAVRGYAETIQNGEPFKPMQQLLTDALTKGAELDVCTPCMKKRGITDDELISHRNIRLIAGADVIRLLKEADRSLQL